MDASRPRSVSGMYLRYELASFAQGGSESFILTTSVPGKRNGSIANTAQVSSAIRDPNTTNNTATAGVRP
jgi:Domain of unknown function DUF11